MFLLFRSSYGNRATWIAWAAWPIAEWMREVDSDGVSPNSHAQRTHALSNSNKLRSTQDFDRGLHRSHERTKVGRRKPGVQPSKSTFLLNSRGFNSLGKTASVFFWVIPRKGLETTWRSVFCLPSHCYWSSLTLKKICMIADPDPPSATKQAELLKPLSIYTMAPPSFKPFGDDGTYVAGT